VLWALGQPAAAAGLAAGFVLGLGLRAVAQRLAALALGVRASGAVLPRPAADVDAIGALAALLGGTGWGCGARLGFSRTRAAWVTIAGPAAVLAASEAALLAFAARYPGLRGTLLLNVPSDILHGVIAPTMAAQLVLSTAVGLLCFGLLALLPFPPLDGYRLARLLLSDGPPAASPVADRLGAVLLLVFVAVPIAGGLPPALAALDVVGTPLLRAWS
jgi:Zn-dependent protease